MQEIWVRLPAEAIFFAISLLQFFKIKFGKFRGIIIYIHLNDLISETIIACRYGCQTFNAINLKY